MSERQNLKTAWSLAAVESVQDGRAGTAPRRAL